MVPEWVAKLADGNPGALTFIAQTLQIFGWDMGEEMLKKMLENNITGSKLYMLWNDCCNRNTLIALNIIRTRDIDDIVKHINYENGSGISYLQEGL